MMPSATLATAGPRYTPYELAELLRLPTRPTAEQQDIIAAPVAPILVVAGAGSGKTETMAARVVWLVANAYVRPEQILGLTFTRKAAGELGSRIRQRLGQLARRLGPTEPPPARPPRWPAASRPSRPTTRTRPGSSPNTGCGPGSSRPTRLLTEASCWQLADAVTRAYAGDMSAVENAPATVIDAVLHLAAELSEHLRTPDDLAAWTGRFTADINAPAGKMYADVARMRSVQQARLAMLPLVRQYTAPQARRRGDGLRRSAVPSRHRRRPARRGRRDRTRPLPRGAARRVPGHQSRPGDAAARICSAAGIR